MSLDMIGHIDDCFESVAATRTTNTGGYVDGLWVDGVSASESHKVNVQPVSAKELQSLSIGGERVNDSRKIYVNDGDLFSITPSDTWALDGIDGVFRCVALDNRPWRNYCKIVVVKIDG